MVKHQQLIEESKTPCAFYNVFTPIFHMDKLACILSLFAHKLNTIWSDVIWGWTQTRKTGFIYIFHFPRLFQLKLAHIRDE